MAIQTSMYGIRVVSHKTSLSSISCNWTSSENRLTSLESFRSSHFIFSFKIWWYGSTWLFIHVCGMRFFLAGRKQAATPPRSMGPRESHFQHCCTRYSKIGWAPLPLWIAAPNTPHNIFSSYFRNFPSIIAIFGRFLCKYKIFTSFRAGRIRSRAIFQIKWSRYVKSR